MFEVPFTPAEKDCNLNNKPNSSFLSTFLTSRAQSDLSTGVKILIGFNRVTLGLSL